MNDLGCLIADVAGEVLNDEDRDILAHPLIGGVILFARNYHSRQQLISLCQQIRQVKSTPLLIFVDQEGGRVQRFISEFTRLPFLAKYGALYDQQAEEAIRVTREGAWLMANELLTAGIDVSLAPVIDIQNKASVIGERAFHRDPHTIIILAKAFIEGMRQAGMSSIGKHFPGHGTVSADSHQTLPIDPRSFAEIDAHDLIPFKGLLNELSAIMAAHIIFPQIDQSSVSYSYTWLTKVLKEKLQFKGLIFSDDLNMEGANISPHYQDRVTAAREAGCDFVLLCNNRQGVIEVLDHMSYQNNKIPYHRWKVLQPNHSKEALMTDRWSQAHQLLTQLN